MFEYVCILLLLWYDDLKVNISRYTLNNNMILCVVLYCVILLMLLALLEDFK